ncbi:MAG: L-aspartate oxidase [Chloroflexota bacterium]|nr:L-aspartate oxidase [Chloroflexota bacterium]MDE2960977.1 L-aspartate oxidase [Chloroflexota bacterium]
MTDALAGGPAGYDYIIIGSGIAGLNTALLAAEHGSVLVVTKGRIDDCNSRYAQGGIAAAIGPGDSATLHQRDTLDAGAGLCDPEAVGVLTGQGPDSIAGLIRWGVPFDTIHGQIALGREGAHSMPRILHAGGDATGMHIEDTLADRVRASERITVLEYTHAIGICVEDGAVTGVEVMSVGDEIATAQAPRNDSSGGDEIATRFDRLTVSGSVGNGRGAGERRVINGDVVVVSTGGAGRLYRYTTNPEVATGDGVALAYLAGAEVMDMEFYQFHPTALWLEGAPTFLLSEAMRGEGAILRNADGEPFMSAYHPMADLAPRDVVSRAIAAEMERADGRPAMLDISHLPAATVTSRFPTIYAECRRYGLDITREPIPVAPAAHYMMGGVRIDTWGRTNIAGLYACGEAACAAVHGANRLASNSLLDTLVFSRRLVEATLGNAPEYAPADDDDGNLRTGLTNRAMVCATVPERGKENLQHLMWRNVGIARNGTRLLLSARILNLWQRQFYAGSGPQPETAADFELRNMLVVARLIVEAALQRRESRGAHYREDFAEASEEWRRHIVLRG